MRHATRFFWLDWLRFSAAFAVLAAHARAATWVPWAFMAPADRHLLAGAFFAVTRLGFEAVVLFLVLSGFLVGGKVIERTLDGTFDAAAFARDRITRVYVPLVPALIFSGFVCWYTGRLVSPLDFLGNVLALQGAFVEIFASNAPLWSLTYEVWLYVFVGCVALVIRRPRRQLLVPLAGIGVAAVMFARLNVAYVLCWWLGVPAYLRAAQARSTSRIAAWAGMTVAVVACVLSQAASRSVSMDVPPTAFLPERSISLVLVAVGLAVAIPSLACRSPRSPAVAAIERLGSAPAAFSYTLYLVHFPVLLLWDMYLPARSTAINAPSIAIYLSQVGSCLAVAWLFYLPFEAQTWRVRKWLRGQPVVQPASVMSGSTAAPARD